MKVDVCSEQSVSDGNMFTCSRHTDILTKLWQDLNHLIHIACYGAHKTSVLLLAIPTAATPRKAPSLTIIREKVNEH